MKDTWHRDRRQNIGPSCKLPADHPVSVRLKVAGMGVEKEESCP